MAAAGNPPTIAGNGGRRPDLTTVLGSCPRIRGFRHLLLVQRATATHITVSACSWLVSPAASNPSRVGRNRGARWIMGHRPPLHAGPTRTSPLGSARGARRFLCFPGRERKENDGSVSTDSVSHRQVSSARSTSFSDSENGAATDRFSKTAR
jgi:hypothetical protein